MFQGGGVKGVALAGALCGFADHADIAIQKWVNVAGTSAGAIVAAYLATGHGPADLETLMHRVPYAQFADWGPGGKFVGAAWNLIRHHGLAHGEAFRTWFDGELGGATFASVRRDDDTSDKTGDPYRLRLIASDVTQHRMLVLPADLASYRLPGTHDPIDPDSFKIADAVRMSMSIPYFFAPVLLESAQTGQTCTIVDGGILSNFPVWLFDVDRTATRPTFGFHLTDGKGVGQGFVHLLLALGWPIRLGVDMVRTTSEAWDERFMTKSTIVRTCPVPSGNIAPTDFTLTASDQQRLFDGGRQAANTFLDHFQARDYVNTFGHKLAQ